MKKLSVLCLFLCGIFFSSCHSGDDTWGDWGKSIAFSGEARVSAVSFQKGDVVYVGMGYNNGVKEADKNLRSFYKFDGNSWSNVEDFPEPGRKGSVAFVIGDTAYVGAGFREKFEGDKNDHYYSDFLKFDLRTNKWVRDARGQLARTDIAGFVSGDNLNACKFWGGLAFEMNGKGYVGCGQVDGRVSKTFFEYDPKTGNWAVCEGALSFPGDPRVGGVCFRLKGKMVVALGSDGAGNVLDVLTFDGKSWETKRPLKNLDGSWNDDYDKIPRAHGVAFTSTLDGEKGYVCGGLSTTAWEYRLEDDRWFEVTKFPVNMRPCVAGVGFSIKGYGYVTVGGSSTRSADNLTTWKFIPGIDEDDNNDY